MSVPDVSGAAIANLEVETLQHKHPTFHGDTIYAETRVLDVKESSSKPDRGIVTVETKGINQRRRRGLLLPPQGHGVEARRGAAARERPYDESTSGPSEAERTLRRDRRRSPSGQRRVRRLASQAERYERARPSYPAGGASTLLARASSASARAAGARPGRRHRQAHPPARADRGRRGRGRAGGGHARPAAWPRARRRGARRHGRGHPARRRLGRRRGRRPRRSTGSTPRRRWPRSHRVLRPGGGLALRLERAGRVGAVGAASSSRS